MYFVFYLVDLKLHDDLNFEQGDDSVARFCRRTNSVVTLLQEARKITDLLAGLISNKIMLGVNKHVSVNH